MKTKIKEFEILWEEIEENFKWKRVYKAMKALDWHWAIDKELDLCGIPNKETIKTCAKDLCREAYDKKARIATGGFEASFIDGGLSLVFSIAHWDVDGAAEE